MSLSSAGKGSAFSASNASPPSSGRSDGKGRRKEREACQGSRPEQEASVRQAKSVGGEPDYASVELARLGVSGQGFGFDPNESMRLFSVEVPAKKDAPVLVCEITVGERPKPAVSIVKAAVSREGWRIVSGALEAEFNGRLRKDRKRAGHWKRGTTPLAERFGKELAVLAWALETVEEERSGDSVAASEATRLCVANWLALSPEERWWLYLMANAKHGSYPDGVGKGWRRAIGVALSESGGYGPRGADLLGSTLDKKDGRR